MFSIFPIDGGVCASDSFFAGSASAGLRADGTPDVAFVYSSQICKAVSLVTTNRVMAAPLRHMLKYGEPFETNFCLVNAKNANAMTGSAGVADVEELLRYTASKYPFIKNPVMSSTGVIGVRLPVEKLKTAIDQLDLSNKDSDAAAKAIMTTDRWQKQIAFRVELEDGSSFRIGGIAKGAGMINPAMATMLCFITTDAAVPDERMKAVLQEQVETTFNAISVDGDTSTNDTVLLMTNKKSGIYEEEAFAEALRLVMHNLAVSMAKDGEGANKLVAFRVSGAKTNEDAQRAAKALSNSMLMKTAIFGEDPNWGRVAAVVGASGAECNEELFTIGFGDVTVFSKGENLFNEEIEKKAHAVMAKDEFAVIVDLGIGEGAFTAYGCDLGYEYVKINADYRT